VTDDPEIRSVLLNDDDWAFADRLWNVFRGLKDLAKFLGLQPHEARELFFAFECDYCGATFGENCRTSTGQRLVTTHKARLIRMLAVISAVQHEPIIHEEEHIEDLLA
jgi:hypothetical protein